MPRNTVSNLSPAVSNISIISTSGTSITLQALVNITNPTPYQATIPYVNIHVVKNGSVLGQATAENLRVGLGNNTNLLVGAIWRPAAGGVEAAQIGRDLISQYLSGYNVSVDIRVHPLSFPSAPLLSRALSGVNISVTAPRLSFPKTPGDGPDHGGDGDDGDDDVPDETAHFIRDATFHVFSSTATFTLVSPLHDKTLCIEGVNATALYNHTEPVGRITYADPIKVPPGASTTPKLPVDWSVGSVGYEAVRKALGGKLKLDARANVSIRLGAFTERFWYEGQGIGANIRF